MERDNHLMEVISLLNPKPKVLKVEDIEEKKPEWLIDGIIPKGQITSLVASGGAGKTTMLCQFISCLTNGKPFWTEDSQEKEPKTILYLSAEDSFETTLKARLRNMGADLSKVLTVSISDELFRDITFTSQILEDLIKDHRPDLLIFDPIQSFIDEKIKLSERNGVRRCVQNLIGYGSEYGTTTILVVHTNKRFGASGRDRMSDSSDLWDVSRSVLMIGKTDKDNIRYMSHEKCNYGMLQQTILFEIHSNSIEFIGRTDKRDEDYVYMKGKTRDRPTPARNDAREFILQSVADDRVSIGELKRNAELSGISKHTFDRAVHDLIEEHIIKRISKSLGKGKGTEWYLMMDITDTPENVPE